MCVVLELALEIALAQPFGLAQGQSPGCLTFVCVSRYVILGLLKVVLVRTIVSSDGWRIDAFSPPRATFYGHDQASGKQAAAQRLKPLCVS